MVAQIIIDASEGVTRTIEGATEEELIDLSRFCNEASKLIRKCLLDRQATERLRDCRKQLHRARHKRGNVRFKRWCIDHGLSSYNTVMRKIYDRGGLTAVYLSSNIQQQTVERLNDEEVEALLEEIQSSLSLNKCATRERGKTSDGEVRLGHLLNLPIDQLLQEASKMGSWLTPAARPGNPAENASIHQEQDALDDTEAPNEGQTTQDSLRGAVPLMLATSARNEASAQPGDNTATSYQAGADDASRQYEVQPLETGFSPLRHTQDASIFPPAIWRADLLHGQVGFFGMDGGSIGSAPDFSQDTSFQPQTGGTYSGPVMYSSWNTRNNAGRFQSTRFLVGEKDSSAPSRACKRHALIPVPRISSSRFPLLPSWQRKAITKHKQTAYMIRKRWERPCYSAYRELPRKIRF